METHITYNEEGLLDGTVDTGSGGCVSQWAHGLLISHYREMGHGWSIRVFKFTTGHYYYSHKQIDYDAQVLRESICIYRYDTGFEGPLVPGMTVFCAYKGRPTFRVVEATERMIRDTADNVLTPLRVFQKKTVAKDIRTVLEGDSVEDVFELLEVPLPAVEVKDTDVAVAEEDNSVDFINKTFNCGMSAIEPVDDEEMDVDVDVEDENM